jgi:spermidine synthase
LRLRVALHFWGHDDNMPRHNLKLLFTLFTLSGFTGLIYESVWSHYLKIFLGAAAFAQSFVLGAFMGGMALGAWAASRRSARLRSLLSAYALVEGLIGLLALVFHEVFVGLSEFSLDHVIPALGSPLAVELYKYSVCALLIVPQTVLLGMTFPLLSGAVVRRDPGSSGHHLAMLYFTNSIGAAIGALAAAFWLLGWLGMPGTMRLAGAMNIALAGVVLLIARRGEPASPAATADERIASAGPVIVRLFLAAAFFTGAASFIYEIAWIRLLVLVLGSSFQAFELMLSAFITGLALGGLWIRRRIDTIAHPVRFAGIVQVIMGLAALATIPVYHETFDWMAWIFATLQRNEGGYVLFNLMSHGIAFAVMLPATFLAGMTLPLFTHALLRAGVGERAIGQVYAWNTLGAIAGVLITVHVLIPATGVKLSLVAGAVVDILLGGWLLRYSELARRPVYALGAILLGLVAAVATARAALLPPERLASGVFRYGVTQQADARVFFYRDGKTASVAMQLFNGGLASIVTNGKPDAAIQLNPDHPPTSDEATMTLAAALPLLIKPEARTFANIGWGSGLTVEVLTSHSGPREIDSIEIEPAMVTAAQGFRPRVLRAYSDPRSHVFFEDAKSYFARHGRKYDVIISEPSNPWVNGVANLFTTEFYRESRRYLAPGGMLVQWLQLYELSDSLLASMVAALTENFADYEVYESSGGDIIVVAVPEGRVPRPGPLPRGEKDFLAQLDRVGVRSLEQVTARSLGTRRSIQALFAPLGAAANSDFRPRVQIEAPRARFEGRFATGIRALADAPLPIPEMLDGAPRAYPAEPTGEDEPSLILRRRSAALRLGRALLDARTDALAPQYEHLAVPLLVLSQRGALCAREPRQASLDQLHAAAEMTLNQAPPDLLRRLWIRNEWLRCPAGGPAPRVQRRLDLYAAVAARDARAMLERSIALLEDPAEPDRAPRRFALLAAMLGADASGRAQRARELWSEYRGKVYGEGDIPPYAMYLAGRP